VRPLLIIAVTIFLGLGCTSPKEIEVMQEQSVGQIPCPSEKIEIIQYKLNQADGSGYWMALCSGRTYKCTRGSGDQTNTINPDVKCEMMESQMPE
jgi:uncharacterized protein YcfL